MKLTANVIGATGLVGKQLVKQLLANNQFQTVRIFVRRDTGIKHPKLEQQIIDFNNINQWKTLLKGNVLFSALGTTLKQAGGQQQQYAIDYTLNYNFAKIAKENNIANYVLISSMSANPKAKLFYPRMKGELDTAVLALNFKHCTILRPGPLAGDRQEKRMGEIIAVPVVRFLTQFILKKYRPIKDSIVAKAMINAVIQEPTDKTIYEGEGVFELAHRK